MIHGFITDCLLPNCPTPLDPSEPLYIVELGAGSGKFSFFLCNCLREMQETLAFPYQNIKVVMTDFTQKNVDYWHAHAAFQPFFQAGVLDTAVYNAVTDSTITLTKSGTVLRPQSLRNPLVIVANYLFDTLCHDIFQVEGGVLKEGKVQTGSRPPPHL
ncbi:hypothetical protein EON64_19505, partial [archaeon]